MTRTDLILDVFQGHNLILKSRPDLDFWPEFQALATCPQDPEWHAEGDVLTHTNMVLEASRSWFSEVGEAQAGLLRLACAFHDIEKPKTTLFSQELQHTIAPGHERRGGVTTRYCLHESPLTGAQRRLVAELVATHHLVKRSVNNFDQPDGPAYLDRLAARVDTRLLWALEMADMTGRICVDQEKQVEIVELFRMLCEERKIFGQAPEPWLTLADIQDLPFATELEAQYVLKETHRRRLLGTLGDAHHARALACQYARTKSFGREVSGHHLHRPGPAHIIITIGVAGSGKTTAISRLPDSVKRISSDDIRHRLYGNENTQGDPKVVFGLAHEELKEVLRVGGAAVFDATNVIPDLRAKVVNLCHDYEAFVTLWVFDTSLKRIKQQNLSRSRQVPEIVIEKQAAKLEWPLPEEAHEIVVFE